MVALDSELALEAMLQISTSMNFFNFWYARFKLKTFELPKVNSIILIFLYLAMLLI